MSAAMVTTLNSLNENKNQFNFTTASSSTYFNLSLSGTYYSRLDLSSFGVTARAGYHCGISDKDNVLKIGSNITVQHNSLMVGFGNYELLYIATFYPGGGGDQASGYIMYNSKYTLDMN